MKNQTYSSLMKNKMALIDDPELLCLVCNSNIDLNNCTNIFYVTLPHNGETLANFIQKVLKLSSSDLRSSYMCLRCYNLFGMLEQAQRTVTNIQEEIFKIFNPNINKKAINDGSVEYGKIEDVQNYSENKEMIEVEKSKLLDAEHLLEKDINSLSSITNQIATNTVISAKVETKNIIESHVISSRNGPKIDSNELDSNVQNIKTESASLADDDIPLFSDEIIQANAEDQSKGDCQSMENTISFQNTTNINNSTNSPNLPERLSPKTKSWKSGGVSKYSRKPLKHTCPMCNKKWRTSSELKTHMKTHSNQRPYMCEKCGQAYKHKHALEIHVDMHNGVSPFRCSHCDKCFTQKGALQRHMPIHTGETPYQCELCGKRFVHHTSYNMHVLSHTGIKSHKCNVCDLSLLSTSHLKRHMRVHTGEKPYCCEFCGKSFAERYNLLAHQKIHDPEQISAKDAKKNQYKCEQCDVNFSKKQKYDEHLKKHEVNGKNDKWLGHTVDIVDSRSTNEGYAAAVNAVDLLETCVNEVWQSLTKD